MRRARIAGRLYPVKTLREIRTALSELKRASSAQRVCPSLTALIKYQPEPPTMVENWQTIVELENSLVGDCEDIANRTAKLLRDKGHDAETWIVAMPTYCHIIVRCDGKLYDPCISAGMPLNEPHYNRYMQRMKVTPL